MNYIKPRCLAFDPSLRQQFDTDRADIAILASLTVKVIRQGAVEHLLDARRARLYFFLIGAQSHEPRTDYYFLVFLGELLQFVLEDLTEMPLTQPPCIYIIKHNVTANCSGTQEDSVGAIS